MTMELRYLAVIVLIVWIILDGIVVFRRKTGKAENRDRRSLAVIVVGNFVAFYVGIYLAFTPYGAMRAGLALQVAGLALMALGITLRSAAIFQLGRFHTPNVAVLEGHQLIDRGLYRHLRHPSYLGALIAFFGLSLALDNWLSLVVIMGISTLAYLYRIHEEEAALAAAFGEGYKAYCRRTRRLLPGLW